MFICTRIKTEISITCGVLSNTNIGVKPDTE